MSYLICFQNFVDIPKRPPVHNDDSVDAKPNRPEFPKLRKTNPADRPSPPGNNINQPEIPAVKLKPVNNPPDDISKKIEPPHNEERPKPLIKKSPPSLPKKPEKPKPPPDLPINARHLNGIDVTKRHSAAVTPSEKPYDVNLKRHSQGAGTYPLPSCISPLLLV